MSLSPPRFHGTTTQAHVVATARKMGEIEAMKFAYPLVGACVVFGAWSAFAAKPKAVTVDAVEERALVAMVKKAEEMGIKGVAVVAVSEGKVVTSWSSKMRVVGSMRKEPSDNEKGANLLAIAYTKAGEMGESLKDSGKAGRPKLGGENGWPGGLIKEVKRGHAIAAFSGGPSEDDVKISQVGLDVMVGEL